VDLIGVDSEDRPATLRAPRHAADTVSDVRFLRDVVPVLRLCDGPVDEQSLSEIQRISACVVVVASQLDELQMTGDSHLDTESLGHVPRLVGSDTYNRVITAPVLAVTCCR
jgi:hypothetical protein